MTVQPGPNPFADEHAASGHADAAHLDSAARSISAEPVDDDVVNPVDDFSSPTQPEPIGPEQSDPAVFAHAEDQPNDDAADTIVAAAGSAAAPSADGNHPAVARAAELLDGISDLPVDEHGGRYEQAHAELQAALADAERPGPAGAR